MTVFAYNNAINASTGYTPFELNCGYYARILFEKHVDTNSKSSSADKLAKELKKLIEIYCQNLFYAQKL